MATCFGCCKHGDGERMAPAEAEVEARSVSEAPLVKGESIIPDTIKTPKIEKASLDEETKDEGLAAPPVSSHLESALNSSPMLRSVAEQFGLVDGEKSVEEEEESKIPDNVLTAIEDMKDGGLYIIKHSRDGKPRPRLIGLTFDERKLTWKDPKKSLGSFIKSKDDRTVSLSTVTEVRPATALDPTTVGASEKRPKGTAGTEIFRKSEAGAKVAKRSFSLIAPSRTFDIECKDEEQLKVLIAAFEYLVSKAKSTPSADTPVKPQTPATSTPTKKTHQ